MDAVDNPVRDAVRKFCASAMPTMKPITVRSVRRAAKFSPIGHCPDYSARIGRGLSKNSKPSSKFALKVPVIPVVEAASLASSPRVVADLQVRLAIR